MKQLILEINKLKKKKKLNSLVNGRISEFSSFKNKSNVAWFSELCYCILTARFQAEKCIDIQKEADRKNAFLKFDKKNLSAFLKKMGHPIYNKRAEYIVKDRKFKVIRQLIQKKSSQEAREWLDKNIKGFGMKEASHFLRNTGRKDVAILDRHILNVLQKSKIIKNPRIYRKKHILKLKIN